MVEAGTTLTDGLIETSVEITVVGCRIVVRSRMIDVWMSVYVISDVSVEAGSTE